MGEKSGKRGPDQTEFSAAWLARLEDLAYQGLTNRTISALQDVDHHTLDRFDLDKVLKRGRARRREDLHRWQTRKAEMGDTTMLIWLGKNELEQTDRLKNEHGGEVKIVVEYVDTPIEELAVPSELAADVAVAAKPDPPFPIPHDTAPIVSSEDERLKKSGLSAEEQRQVKEYRESRAILQRTFPNARWN